MCPTTLRARLFESMWNVPLGREPGLRIPNMFEAALDGSFRGLYIQGEDFAQSDPNTAHVTAALSAMECIVIQDIFHNETSRFAHVFLPGSSFLEKDGTFTNAERRISRVRKVMEPLGGLADWEVTMRLSNALGYPMNYAHPSEIMDEIAALTPTFTGVSYEKLDRLGSIQWPCNEQAPDGTPTMHVGGFVRGKGRFYVTAYVPTSERTSSRYPLLLTTGRVLTQYNVGAQTRRTANMAWHSEDRLELHPHDAEARGIEHGDWVGVTSRAGDTVLRVEITDRVAPGVVYTTFHFPESGANLITTENSDWATNCPEYKVTAVQVVKVAQPSAWRQRRRRRRSPRRPPPDGHCTRSSPWPTTSRPFSIRSPTRLWRRRACVPTWLGSGKRACAAKSSRTLSAGGAGLCADGTGGREAPAIARLRVPVGPRRRPPAPLGKSIPWPGVACQTRAP